MTTSDLNPAMSTAIGSTGSGTVPLHTLADVIRSKNSGPFELTLDVFFRSAEIYGAAKEQHIISKELIGHLYGIDTNQILEIVYYDAALAVKVTMARPASSGSPADTDVYGAQQHMPLADALVYWTGAPPEEGLP